MLHPLIHDYVKYETRRQFFRKFGSFMGSAALASLMPRALGAAAEAKALGPHFAPKAKHIIYLHMVGGPSQIDLYDYKPKMPDYYDKDLPESVRMGQRLTTMTSGQARFPIAPSKYKFEQYGKSGSRIQGGAGRRAQPFCSTFSPQGQSCGRERPAGSFVSLVPQARSSWSCSRPLA